MVYRGVFAALAVLLAALALACGGGGGSPAGNEPQATSTPEPTTCASPAGEALQPMAKTYSQRPAMTIDRTNKYTAVVNTVRGSFTIELRPDIAAETVNSFVFLAQEGYFDGVTFHRVEPGFVAQGGDPTGTGAGGPGYTLPAEFSEVPYERGTVGMARTSDPNSAGSQWFVTLGQASHLNGQYTVFGQVTQGMEVVDCIAVGDAIVGIDIQEG